MAGYAASARLQGGATHVVPVSRSERRATSEATPAEPPARPDRTWVELAGRPFGAGLVARWDDLREAWSQTTFFLFDPESWRR